MNSKLARQTLGLLLGIGLFVALLALPDTGNFAGPVRKAAACAVLMAVWWISEAIPIPATALLPLALFPVLRIMPAKEVAVSYADQNIFLFMGGFFIALAMQRHNLHKRIALLIIKALGTSLKNIVFGFMLATGFLSMWISNTATAMMMFPIALAIIDYVRESLTKEGGEPPPKYNFNFGIALMLGIAYAASIGGTGTLVGTPPNIILAGIAKNMLPGSPEIGFVQWMAVGLPVVAVFLPLAWLYLVYVGAPLKNIRINESKAIITRELQSLGRMSRGERYTLAIFILTALGWVFRRDLHAGPVFIPGWSDLLGIQDYVHDSTVAMAGALLTFVVPLSVRKPEFILNWDWAVKIPWGILLLFGGGFALASGFQATGLDEWIGGIFSEVPSGSVFILIITTCLLLTFLTEVTSNTATTSMMLPVLAALALSMDIHPYLLMIPATFATSFAFMMPVATPPNAIVFGSEYLTIPKMARTGFILNLAGVAIITAVMYLIVWRVFSLSP